MQQRTLLQLEYYTEKEAFRKLTEQMGMQRKVKRGDAWFPLQVGKSFYNSLNQTAIEVSEPLTRISSTILSSVAPSCSLWSRRWARMRTKATQPFNSQKTLQTLIIKFKIQISKVKVLNISPLPEP